jgi:hypothetical protein
VGEVAGSPLRFLHQSDWLDWEDVLTASDNVQVLQKRAVLFCDDLFRAFGESTRLKESLSFSLAEVLVESIGQKLRRYYPHDSTKDTSTLLRWHTAEAVSFLEQALAYLVDVWMEQLMNPDRETLEQQCERVSISLKQWPVEDMRARPEHGKTSQLVYLRIFEDAMKSLKGLPRQPYNGYEEKQRREFLDRIFEELPSVQGRQGWRLHHPQSNNLFFDVPDNELTRWAKTLSRKQIALEITVAVVRKTGVPLTVESLRRLLPKLRANANHIDRALQATEV